MNENATLPKKKGVPWAGLLVAIFIVVIFVGSVIPPLLPTGGVQTRGIAMYDIMNIRSALQSYVAEFGVPLSGDNVEILTTLRGKNPNQIVFFEGVASRFNARGEYLDPWKHPYRIDASNPDFVWVYSFGKNGIDEGGAEGSDDVASWR